MQLVLAFLTAAGVGGIVGAIVQSHLQHRTHVREQQHALREKRYLCILILMLSRLNRRAGLLKLREVRPDLGSNYDIDNELEAEYLNAFVFAGDAVLSSFGHFVADPTHDNFATTASAMRAELWGIKGSLATEFVRVIESFPEPRRNE